MNEVAAKKAYSRFGFTYTAMYWVYVAVIALFLIIRNIVISDGSMSDQIQMLIYFGIRFVIIYPLMYFFIRKLPKFEIKKNKLGIGGFIACLFITYFLMIVANIVGMVLNSLIGNATGNGAVNPLMDVVDGMSPIVMIVIVAVLAPVWEELLFRKFLIDRVVNYGEVTAMLMSGVMFGLYHGNLAQCAYAFAIGCFLAFIYIRTGKIGYTIAIHMFINGFSTYLTKFMLSGVNIAEMQGYLLNGDTESYTKFVQENMVALAGVAMVGLFVIVAVFVGFILAIVLRKKFVFEHHEEEIEKGKRFKTAVLNPGMILYMIYWIATVILTQFNISVIETFLEQLGG
jgi:membrane protease YdiL (CAAX protease family)